MNIKFKNREIKNLFEKIGGRPREGDIVECFKPSIVLPMGIISFFCMVWAVIYHNIFFGFFSMMFAWQIGWGMSIERFSNSEKNKLKEKANKKPFIN